MSVLIPIDMPKNCAVCPMQRNLFGASLCVVPHDNQNGRRIYEAELPPVGSECRRPYWCPLIEVKTPHGRLIDADTAILASKQPTVLDLTDCEAFIRECETIMEAET